MGPCEQSVLTAIADFIIEGELVDLIDEFSDGRTQFGYVKVKDPNTGLPKNALIAWCGEGVPERTKGYFGSHLAAVAKLLHVSRSCITPVPLSPLTQLGIPCPNHGPIGSRPDSRRYCPEGRGFFGVQILRRRTASSSDVNEACSLCQAGLHSYPEQPRKRRIVVRQGGTAERRQC